MVRTTGVHTTASIRSFTCIRISFQVHTYSSTYQYTDSGAHQVKRISWYTSKLPYFVIQQLLVTEALPPEQAADLAHYLAGGTLPRALLRLRRRGRRSRSPGSRSSGPAPSSRRGSSPPRVPRSASTSSGRSASARCAASRCSRSHCRPAPSSRTGRSSPASRCP
jgi:hypothetical protein